MKKKNADELNKGNTKANQTGGCCHANGPQGGLHGRGGCLGRRDFLKLVGLSSAASLGGGSLFLTPRRIMAGDFNYTLIPANKNLDPAWVASLFARGTPTVVTAAADLNNIGMPVGGICCGQLYLSGDGRLWYWDIFNSPTSDMLAGAGIGHYANPFDSTNPPVNQGFALKIGAGADAQYFKLDATGFANVAFTGQYPIGTVNYSDPACPVTAMLEAFSPFIPLDADDSGIPATVMEFTLTNAGQAEVAVEIAGWLQNAVCRFTNGVDGIALNHLTVAADHVRITASVQDDPSNAPVVYDDFERTTYAPWVAAGTAFGSGPVDLTNYPSSSYQDITGGHGRYVVNSHASAPGSNSVERDQATGTLTSPVFTLNYDLVLFLVCGGNNPGLTCFNLCLAADNSVLMSATGADSNAMTEQTWTVTAWKGQQVYFQIVDNATGGWGNIGVDYIRFASLGNPDTVFDDFERTTYAPWVASGAAFGAGPVDLTNYPSSSYQVITGGHGRYVVNSHASAPGSDSVERDQATGTLTSPVFTIWRNCISFLICGGDYPGLECLNLCLASDNSVLMSATGADSNAMTQQTWDVRAWLGQEVYFQIVDNYGGSWGNIGVDYIVFSDSPAGGWVEPEDAPDQGTMCLALLNPQAGDNMSTDAPTDTLQDLFANLALDAGAEVTRALPGPLAGALSRPLTLAAGAQETVTFVVAWHFPKTQYGNASVGANGWDSIQDITVLQRYYATLFTDAGDVASYVAGNYASLAGQTRLWRDTWYDSTLPYWFLDRTFGNISTLATATAHRFSNGRFWGWEGIYCCPGTCIHVWEYAQAMARIFPEIERGQRQNVDFGIGFNSSTGQVYMRAENSTASAVDGQAGVVLRAYREHQMSADSSFLAANWPNIKLAMQWLISFDYDSNGILQGAQGNTLDASWYGKIAWLSGLYVAACKACQQMAIEMGDTAFATQLGALVQAGVNYLGGQLFYNSEYFIQLPDDSGNNIGAAWGCEIDQVLGQSWAFQVGLGQLLDQGKTWSALKRLWTYNFAPDAGGFRLNPLNPVAGGRTFAEPGESGLVMSTFPDPANPAPLGLSWTASYFNECMTGFEHEVASHMIWAGMLLEGLAVTRAVHDRYLASKRNPYNEIECSDHYARAMASYGSHIAVSGYEYHGPKGCLAFSPKLTPENFKAAFTAAQGWGSFTQTRSATQQTCAIAIQQGQLQLNTLAFDVPAGSGVGGLSITLNGAPVAASMSRNGNRITATLASPQTVLASQTLVVQIGLTGFSIVQGTPVKGGFQVTWTSVPGNNYAVEFSDSLPANSWTPLATNIAASSGTTTSYTDTSVAGAAARFYRVRTAW